MAAIEAAVLLCESLLADVVLLALRHEEKCYDTYA